MKTRILQTDFRSGQVDRVLDMRVDSKVYPSGAKSLKNMLLRSTGAVERRPGTLRRAALNQRSKLLAFEFDRDEQYVLAFGNNHLRIYNPDGSTVASFTGSTDSPWDADKVWEMTTAQLADVMYIAHDSFKPKKLTRTGLSSYMIEDFAFAADTSGLRINQPHYKYELPTVRVGISNTAIGTGRTLTASSGIFSSAWVGKRLRLFDCEIEITAYTNATTCTATVHQEVKAKLDPNPIRSKDGSGLIEVTQALHGLSTGDSVTFSGIDTASTDVGLNESALNITATITVIDEDRYTFTAGSGGIADKSLDFGGTSVEVRTTATTRSWTEQAFSTHRGWPGAVAFHDDRLWFGGSPKLPTGIFSSIVGGYNDFNVADGEDDMSIQGVLSTSKFGKIRHILSGPQLQVFTETSEIVVMGGQNEALTPENFRIKSDTTYGSGNVAPALFDGGSIFSQRNGKALRELVYDYQSESFRAPSLSPQATDQIKYPIDMDVLFGSTTRAEQYAIIVNGDGTAALFHSIRNEDLAAWAPMQGFAAHDFDSVCVVGNSVFFSIKIGSTWYLNEWALDRTDIWLDNAKEMTAAATTSWNLGSGYANATVSVMSNGHYLGDFVANGSGVITLPEAVTGIVAGYDYGIEVIPLPPDMQMPNGPMTGEIRRIVTATPHFLNTVNARVAGQVVVGYDADADFSLPPEAFSGKRRVRMLGYDRDPTVITDQTQPGPITLLGMSMEVSI